MIKFWQAEGQMEAGNGRFTDRPYFIWPMDQGSNEKSKKRWQEFTLDNIQISQRNNFASDIFANSLQPLDCEQSYLTASKMPRLKLKTYKTQHEEKIRKSIKFKAKGICYTKQINTGNFWQVWQIWEEYAWKIWKYN